MLYRFEFAFVFELLLLTFCLSKMLKNKEVNIPVLAAHGEHSETFTRSEADIILVITTWRLFREM